MTAAADLTPESTIDQPGEAEPTVAEPTVDAIVDQPGGGDEPDGTEPVVDQLTETEPGVDEGAATEADAAEQPDPEPQDAGPSAEAEAAPGAGLEEAEPTAKAADAAPGAGLEEAEPAVQAEVTPEAAATPAAELDDAEPAAEADADGVPAPEPLDVRPPAPRPPLPQPAAPRPAPARSAAGESWGRVDEDGTVSVREGDEWRVVGQYPDGSPEEALAYYERKFADLASEVGLLEVRYRRGGASAADLRSAARTVNAKLEGAAAVGDLASLTARVAALTQSLAAASESEAAAARAAVDDAVRSRTELVEKVEAIAARDPRSVQWKQASAEVSALFDQWQSEQQNGPRLPKSTAQQLWKRFRDARATFDKHRREFYAELDEAHKGVRDRKTRLVERAEALSSKGEDGIPAYRELLDEWKTAGRAGKKIDDALWARFKAAGDALYSARIERESADAAASRENIEAKRALLEEARAVTDERDIAKARTLLTGVQRQWDEIGRIFPRDAERALDDELRKIEQGLRTREEADWKRNNPETKARANDMTRQLTEAIQKLEDELAAAERSGNKAAIAKASEALEARRSWLNALGG